MLATPRPRPLDTWVRHVGCRGIADRTPATPRPRPLEHRTGERGEWLVEEVGSQLEASALGGEPAGSRDRSVRPRRSGARTGRRQGESADSRDRMINLADRLAEGEPARGSRDRSVRPRRSGARTGRRRGESADSRDRVINLADSTESTATEEHEEEHEDRAHTQRFFDRARSVS